MLRILSPHVAEFFLVFDFSEIIVSTHHLNTIQQDSSFLSVDKSTISSTKSSMETLNICFKISFKNLIYYENALFEN